MELVAEKYKQTEVGLIPSDWDLKTIGDIFIFYSTSNFSKAEMTLDGEVGCVHYGLIHAINNTSFSLRNGVKFYVTKEQAKYEALQNGDVVMVDASEDLVGLNKSVEVSGITGKEYIAGLHTFHLRDKNSTYINSFRGLVLNSDSVKKQMLRVAVGMKVFGVSKPQLQQIFVPVPTKAEQTAIATALSDADALISSLEKLIVKKRNIKQGAMQQLLQPKEGWEVKKLGEIVEKITTGKLDANAANENGAYRFYTCAKNYFFINEYAFDDEALLVSGNGENVGYVHYYKGRFNAYQRTYVITGFNQNIHFVKIYLDRYLPERIDSEVNSGNTPYIKMGTLTDMRISLPDMREQTRIVTILSDMDAEIAALETKLEKYRNVKLGMMQNLLTGKIRLI
jgi:type I restriction enzyme S subunit